MSLPLANVFQPLIDAFEAVLVFFHDQVGLGWGLSIIALTVVVRAVLLPLTVKQFKSMQAMQQLAPQMKALQQKHKSDKQRQQQELMALYKEHKVNPFSSCLPLVAQLPVFLSLFYMLQKDLRQEICNQTAKPCANTASEFLFIPDITDKATGAVLVALVVLYIGSQLLSSVLMANQIQDKNQRMLMIGLPFVFTIFILNFPAGLITYWITTNLWTVGQSYVLRRRYGIKSPSLSAAIGLSDDDDDEAPARGDANGKDREKEKAKPAEDQGRTSPPPPPRRKRKRSGRRR